MKIAVIPGDGIGPEVVHEAVHVLDSLGAGLEFEFAAAGACATDAYKVPLPDATLSIAKTADAVLFGAVGDPRHDHLDRRLRPEQAILRLRAELGLFANLRPAICFDALAGASSLKHEFVSGLDLVIVRELTGDIYFGEPRGRRKARDGAFEGADEGFDTMRYSVPEVTRIAHLAFKLAHSRRRKVTSVDKANVLETSLLWRETVSHVHGAYPDVQLEHMYVDNAAMQLIKSPRSFDVILTGNMFGDILSDEAGMITGSIGMLPSASLDPQGKGLYEPSHGSAPDIAGKGIANPLATILSAAMMLRHSLGRPQDADRVERAVREVLLAGLRTADIASAGTIQVSTRQMGAAVLAALHRQK